MEIEATQREVSSDLEEKLLRISPWLSSEVLAMVLDKRSAFSSNFISKILAANPEALFNNSLQLKMENLLSADELNAAITAQSNTTERSALEGRLADAGTIMGITSNAIIHHYLVTEPVDLKEVRTWLYAKQDLESAYQIVESWLQEEKTQQANEALIAILNQFSLTEDQQFVYDDYKNLTDLKINAMNNDRTIADFNEAEVLKLAEIADRNRGRAGEQARGILNFFYDYQYVTESDPLEEGINITQRDQATEPILEHTTMVVPVTAYPNPVSGEVTFQFNGLDIELQNAFIQIVDINGRIAKRLPINHISETITWNITSIEEGIYAYQLINKGEILFTDRLVVKK